MKTFSQSASWTVYRRLLADEFGLVLTREPKENWLRVRGHHVRVDEWLPQGEAKGTVILVHGGGGNGRILAPAAEPIVELGWRVISPDLPGYGLTETAPEYDWDYAEWPSVIAAIADSQAGTVVLMGLSMGGLTAFFAAQQSAHVSGVIATTLLDLSDPKIFSLAARWRWLGHLSRFSMKTIPWLFDRVRMPLSLATPLKAMSSSRAMQRYFADDKLIGASWKPARFFRTVHQYRAQNWQLDCPLLLVHPGADSWTPTAQSKAVYDRIKADKQFVELTNGSHLPVEQPAYQELAIAIGKFLRSVAGKG
ncbi:alpha/beta hydrolase [Porphyrobacter sp. LM 6]|uniref:alpha/beta hydrolase n=1 Tax=Porphyrobacter sp. LM 6 TaxID=1896196 RepID=UPI0009F41262|nr:alpha/beta hydrolase [Porphyrobacter sp. LM 6]